MIHYRHAMVLSLLLSVIGAQNVLKGQTMTLHLIGKPCLANNILAGVTVTDRATGRELFIMANSSEGSGLELFVIDVEQNTARVIKAPAGQGSWGIREVPGDRLIIGTYYDGTFLVFDLVKMEFTHSIKVPGEQYIWNLALGGDGRVYGGTYPGGKLIALDLEKNTIEDCGNPAPPNMYLMGISTLGDGRVIGNFGYEKSVTMIYDIAGKKFQPAPDHAKGTLGLRWGDTWLAGSGAFGGADLAPVVPYPAPVPPAEKGAWYLDAPACTPETLCMRQGNAIYLARKGQPEAELLAELDLRGGRLLAGSRQGAVLGIRGQDYFVIRKGDTSLQLRPMPVIGSPRPLGVFLKSDAKGRLWSGPMFGQTLCMLDPDTGQIVNTGTVCDTGGEVYDFAELKNKMYTVSYSGGDITEYDPALPWNQIGNRNPRLVASVGSRGYIRPVGGIKLGSDGLLYSGWWVKYAVYGGAVAITNPQTGQTDLIENPLGEQSISGLAVDGKRLYVGTSVAANGLPNKPGESPQFGVVDLETRKVIFRKEFPDVTNVTVVGMDVKTRLVPVLMDGKIILFDSTAMTFTTDQPLKAPASSGYTWVMPGDGYLTYASSKKVVRLDLSTGMSETLATSKDGINHVARTPKGRLFVSCGADVYEMK